MNFIAENEEDLVNKVYMQIQDKLLGGFKVGLSADLGAGKTTLVKGIALKLKIKEPVTSPTFNIRKEYPFIMDCKSLILQHIDLYRLENDEYDKSEFNDWISDKNAVTFVEWPENLSLSEKIFDLFIKIEVISSTKRKVILKWK